MFAEVPYTSRRLIRVGAHASQEADLASAAADVGVVPSPGGKRYVRDSSALAPRGALAHDAPSEHTAVLRSQSLAVGHILGDAHSPPQRTRLTPDALHGAGTAGPSSASAAGHLQGQTQTQGQAPGEATAAPAAGPAPATGPGAGPGPAQEAEAALKLSGEAAMWYQMGQGTQKVEVS
jgi:hypothetical protein